MARSIASGFVGLAAVFPALAQAEAASATAKIRLILIGGRSLFKIEKFLLHKNAISILKLKIFGPVFLDFHQVHEKVLVAPGNADFFEISKIGWAGLGDGLPQGFWLAGVELNGMRPDFAD